MRKYVLLLCLAGCTVGPNYVPPENNVVDAWASPSDIASRDAPVIQWWELFQDPMLNKYVAAGAENNQDLLTATSRIFEARALRKVAASSYFPQVGADVNATRTYFSKNGPIFAIGPSVGSVPGTVSTSTGLPFDVQIPQTQNLYNALFDASWEIDLFGKTRRSVQAAEAIIGQAIEERSDTLITVIGEIARNYMELRGFQKKAKLIEENIALLEAKAMLVRQQFEAGYISRLGDEEIEAMLAEERAKLPDIQGQIYRDIYALSVLTGAVPEALIEELLPRQDLPKVPETVAVGLRSDLLRRRPDVRGAERQLAAATANIGVAVASFFPTFNLLGDGGFQSLLVKNLFSMGSKTWALGGDLNMPIFEGGRLMGNLQAKRAEADVIAHTYQQTVLTALEETESALVSYTQDLATLLERKKATDRYQELVALSQERHDLGLIDLLHLIDAKREWNQSEQALVDSNVVALVDVVALYKALGGGWETTESQR
jgi:NodT family efflux transporter outer membrane factor (OMF) lipoprotein